MHRWRLEISVLLLVLGLCGGGCSNRYVITTTYGTKLVTASKPKLVESRFEYKDASGQIVTIPAMRVRLIEPYSKEAAPSPAWQPDLLDQP